MKYKDDKGNVLYGFSQENLERTNKEIKKTNKFLQILIILFIIFLAVFVSFLIWLEINNVFTRIIYS